MPEEIVGSPADGSPTPSPTPTPSPSPTPTPTPSPTPAPAPVDGSVEDKRFKGIQADLAKERKARQTLDTQYQTAVAELAAEKRRVQALAGVTPQSPQTEADEKIRARFAELYPHLGELSVEDIQNMREMAEERKSLQATTNHYWQNHGRAMVSSINKEIENVYGGELSARQKDAVLKAYTLHLQANPDDVDRHEAGDQTLVKEFAKNWVDDWFEPARRKVTASEVNQFRKVPNGKDRNIVTQGEKKINVNNNDEVMDLLVAGRTFTGRNQR